MPKNLTSSKTPAVFRAEGYLRRVFRGQTAMAAIAVTLLLLIGGASRAVGSLRIELPRVGVNSVVHQEIARKEEHLPKEGKTKENQPPPLAPAPPPRELAERIEFPFREALDKQPLLSFFGSEVESMAKVDAQGLRFSVPAERSNNGPVGVASKVRLHGDFEITLAFELLAVPDPAPELGVGVAMRVEFESANSLKAHIVRTHTPKGEGAGANYTTVGPDGKEIFKGLSYRSVKDMKGRLRLVRTGSKLSYQIADGGDLFRVLATKEVGTADIIGVKIQCTTGWQTTFGVEARLTSLELRAEKIVLSAPPPALTERVEFKFCDGIEKLPGLRFAGPDAAALAKTDGQGLCFKVPADRESGAPVGLETKVRLRGDFEITLAFELLAVPNPPPKWGAGLDMRVEFDTADSSLAHLGRVQNPSGAVFGANFISKDPDGKEIFKGMAVRKVKGPSGRMRLIRRDKTLIYQFADGDGSYQTIATKEFGAADVIGVQAQCVTGWESNFGVDVRLVNLDLRAQQMPDKDAPSPAPSPDAPNNVVVPMEANRRTSLVVVGLILGLVLLLTAGSAGLWFVLAKRRNAGAPLAVSAVKHKPNKSPAENSHESAASPLLVVCGGCGKKLKVKAELDRKKIKCPQCGHLVLVPETTEHEADPASS